MGRPLVLSPVPSNVPKAARTTALTAKATKETKAFTFITSSSSSSTFKSDNNHNIMPSATTTASSTAATAHMKHAFHDRRNAPRQRSASLSSLSSVDDIAEQHQQQQYSSSTRANTNKSRRGGSSGAAGGTRRLANSNGGGDSPLSSSASRDAPSSIENQQQQQQQERLQQKRSAMSSSGNGSSNSNRYTRGNTVRGNKGKEDAADKKRAQQQTTTIDHLSPGTPPSRAAGIEGGNHNTNTKQQRTRHALVEIFSPVRAMRVARAGMKRKRGGGALQMGTTRRSESGVSSSTAAAAALGGSGGSSTSKLSASGAARDASASPIASGSRLAPEAHLHQTSTNAASEAGLYRRTSAASSKRSSSGGAIGERHPAQRPPYASRDASSSSLRRNMRAMRLSDREEADKAEMQSKDWAAPMDADEEAEDEEDDDEAGNEEDDAEMARLLHSAPSWQLRRLNKSKLFKLHILLGTFSASQRSELDSYSKQDLVDGIVRARSHENAPRSHLPHENVTPPSRPLRRQSHPQSGASMKRSNTNSTLMSRSSEYTDMSDEEPSETDANDAAGEETEAEPSKPRRKHFGGSSVQGASRLRHTASRTSLGFRPAEAFPMRKDASLGGASTRSSSIMSPERRRLRQKGSLFFAASSPARTRARTRNQSTSSSMQTVRARNGQLPFGQRMLRANAAGELEVGATAASETPKPLRKRRSLAQLKLLNPNALTDVDRESESEVPHLGNDAEGDEDVEEMQEWIDTSPTVARRRPLHTPRKAKVRAQRQLQQRQQQALAEDSEAMVENVLDGPRGADGAESDDIMSLDERRAGSPQLSDMSLDDTLRAPDSSDSEDGEEEYDDDENSELGTPSDFDTNASPSKMRRLRNGKVRMPTTFAAAAATTAHTRQSSAATLIAKPAATTREPTSNQSDQQQSIEYTLSSLNRQRRDRLVQLCQEESIDHARDATRAVLIDLLLEHRGPPASGVTERPESTASSARTARPESSLSGSGSYFSSSSRGRSKAARSSNTTLSEKPLLLRTRSLERQTISKPGTPVPTPNSGEEELNGLDLESLQLVDKEIPFSKLEKLDKIGSGGFKDVYVGKYQISKKTTKKVAIADIRDQLSDMDIKELTLLRDLRHENIVRFIGVCIPPPDMRLTPCMIVSELCANGDLYDYIRNTPPPPDEEIFRIMLETARGLEYLHLRTPAIIHRDCKSTNVLITRNRTAKINDFGLARVRNNKRSMIKSLVGTVNWQAVELWTPKPSYNEKVDVWSAAMTFWETLQWHQPEKKYPFQDMNEHQIYLDVGQKKLRPPTISIRRHYGSEIVDLLDRMWDHSAKLRPTMSEVCEELETLVAMKKEAAAAKAAANSSNNGTKASSAAATTRNASR